MSFNIFTYHDILQLPSVKDGKNPTMIMNIGSS